MKKEENTTSKSGDNSFGVSSVVMGIVSIILSLNAPLGSLFLGIVALIFANKQNSISANKWSKNGRTLAIIGIILGVVLLVATFWAIRNIPQLQQLAQR